MVSAACQNTSEALPHSTLDLFLLWLGSGYVYCMYFYLSQRFTAPSKPSDDMQLLFDPPILAPQTSHFGKSLGKRQCDTDKSYLTRCRRWLRKPCLCGFRCTWLKFELIIFLSNIYIQCHSNVIGFFRSVCYNGFIFVFNSVPHDVRGEQSCRCASLCEMVNCESRFSFSFLPMAVEVAYCLQRDGHEENPDFVFQKRLRRGHARKAC